MAGIFRVFGLFSLLVLASFIGAGVYDRMSDDEVQAQASDIDPILNEDVLERLVLTHLTIEGNTRALCSPAFFVGNENNRIDSEYYPSGVWIVTF